VSDIEEPTILKCAVLKKLKGSHQYKKKFFVLLGNSSVIYRYPTLVFCSKSVNKKLIMIPPPTSRFFFMTSVNSLGFFYDFCNLPVPVFVPVLVPVPDLNVGVQQTYGPWQRSNAAQYSVIF
jgi:hypothetical protein